jgi:FtsP/CotA-like multicopper oxidase with cupredoxin domain
MEYGGGAHEHGGGLAIAALHGPAGPPDVRLRLVAQHAKVRLPSGRTLDALTFDGRLPGPELRVEEGQVVEVTLLNRDVDEGVSIHWHGVDLPIAEDGVAGVTQDAVPPGRSFVYRFRAPTAGTYWYHSHQDSAEQVERGLYGALVVAPPRAPAQEDVVALAHTLDGVALLGASDGETRRDVPAGKPVRLRLLNSSDATRRFALDGTSFRVVAIDGRDRRGGGSLQGVTIAVPAGGRYDLAFAMPSRPVRLAVRGQDVGLVLDPGSGAVPEPHFGPEFDPNGYGTPAAPVPARFDRRFHVDIGRRLGFFAGGYRLGWQWTINGKTYPHMPMFMVARGDRVELSFSNHSGTVHPMHLHGHHMLVFAHDGRRTRPFWVDTLDIRDGETYDAAVFATNPGVWMFHCHILPHAAQGLVTHLGYIGVTTPFRMGSATKNDPE